MTRGNCQAHLRQMFCVKKLFFTQSDKCSLSWFYLLYLYLTLNNSYITLSYISLSGPFYWLSVGIWELFGANLPSRDEYIEIKNDMAPQTMTHNSCVKAGHSFTHVMTAQLWQYCDVIMASQITSLTILYSIVHSGADQRKYQSSASQAFVWGIHRWPVNSLHKWPVTWKCSHLMMSS